MISKSVLDFLGCPNGHDTNDSKLIKPTSDKAKNSKNVQLTARELNLADKNKNF